MSAQKSVIAVVAAVMSLVLVRGAVRAPEAAADASEPRVLEADQGDREGDLVVLIEDDQEQLHIITAEADTFFEQMSVLSDASSEGEILAIERDTKAASEAAIDPLRPSQYGLDAIGVDRLPGALDGSGVVVAVLDTGILRTHEELLGRLLPGADCVHATAETAGTGCDESTSGPADRYHGTHIAALIGASRGNGVGIHGVAPGAMLLPVRVLDENGTGYWSDVAQGVIFAIEQDVDVINLSIDGESKSLSLELALQRARDEGIVIVVAAGNDAKTGNNTMYPAAFSSTFSVAAVDSDLTASDFSSYGSWVDVSAAGVDIWSAGVDVPNPSDSFYRLASGTSMAAPQVAGLAALLLQANPGLTVSEVEQILKNTARDLGKPGRDDHFGAGLVQAPAAVASAWNQLSFPGLNGDYSEGEVLLSWSSGDFVTGYELIKDGAVIATLASGVTSYFDLHVSGGHTYKYELRVVYPLGASVTVDLQVSAFDPSGYWMAGKTGSVYPFGEVGDFGDSISNSLLMAISSANDGGGYWLLSENGAVEAFGSAVHFGNVDLAALDPGEMVSSISGAPTGDGYWVFTDRGRVITFGNASFYGDLTGYQLNGPVVGSAATPTGHGYFMIASDGGVFAFGDAVFAGSMGGVTLNEPVVGIAPDPDGLGYWLVASDGGIFAFAAEFYGSMGGSTLNAPVRGAVASGSGYLMVASDGGVFAFGGAKFNGSLGADSIAAPVVGITPR